MNFYSSDFHFFHKSTLRPDHSNRPFSSVEEMHEVIFDNFNSLIRPTDTLYFLGDFAPFVKKIDVIYELRKCFRVRDFHFILGNHDWLIKKNKERLLADRVFNSISDLKEVNTFIDGQKKKIILSHYAMRTWKGAHHGNWHLYAHSHGNLPEDNSYSFDVGVDPWRFQPVSEPMVAEKMKTKAFTPVDHHGKLNMAT